VGMAIVWWGALTLLGWLTWPLLAAPLHSLPARGYAWARPFGLLLLSYIYWLLGVAGLLPNSREALWGVGLGVSLVGLAVWAYRVRFLSEVLRREWRHVLVTELLFAFAFALYAWHKAHDPAINHTEEPMDFAFLNGLLHSPSLPPRDPWMSGQTISYYYLGYLTVAVLTRLTGVASGVGYNLGLAHTFALTVVGSFGVVAALTPMCFASRRALGWPNAASVVGGLAIPLLGNLEGPLELLRALGVGGQRLYNWLAVPGLAEASPTGAILPAGAWWWRASRVMQDVNLLGRTPTVITEFPAFSFLLGDLHPHVMALPYATLALACACALYHWQDADTVSTRAGRVRAMLFFAWVIGALGFLNSWDLPTYLALCLSAFALSGWRAGIPGRRWAAQLVLATIGLGVGSVLLYGPFWAYLNSQAQGLGLAYYAKTPLRHYVLCLGVWLIPLGAMTLMDRRDLSKDAPKGRWIWLLILFLPWFLSLLWGGPGRLLLGVGTWIGRGPWLLLLQSIWLAALVRRLWASRATGTGVCALDLAWLLALFGLGLTYLTEFIYLRDLFDTRMNTLFKVYYQVWVLLGVAAFAGLPRLWRQGAWGRGLTGLSMALLCVALYYPVAAAYTRANAYRDAPQLDGTAYLRQQAPDEYETYRWLNVRAGPNDVVLEAVGEEYVPWTSRLSAWTGVPTVLGWPGHEAQWRGDDVEVKQRQADVITMYTTTDQVELWRLLRAYHVTWVYVGPYEREIYHLDADRLRWLDQTLSADFSAAGIRLYRVPTE
jgi:YYY domain-containing protein